MAKTQKAGWYADPQQPGSERYWDGGAWDQQTRLAPPGRAPKKRRGGLVLKIALGMVLGCVVLIGGCVALIGAGVDSAQKDQDKHAISRSQYRTVNVGDTKTEVRAATGNVAPSDGQEFENEGLDSASVKSSCDYYNEKGKTLGAGSYFQLCYDGSKLTSKNAY